MITTREMRDLQEFSHGFIAINKDRKNTALIQSVVKQKPFTQFDKFVPENATGFTVTTGINIGVFYDGVIDFIKKEVPEDGPAMIEKWDGVQAGIGVDLKRDVFDWFSGEIVSVSLPGMMGTQANGVLFIRTKNSKLAWEKITQGLTFLDQRFEQLTVSPAPNVNSPGFVSVFHAMMMMMQIQPVVGMYEDWIVIGTKPGDVNACLAAARGEAATIRTNARFKNEGLSPDGTVVGASFADMSKRGEELGMAFGMMGMMGAMIPDQPELRPMRTVFTLMSRLAPVMSKIDFIRSSASTTTYVGNGWKYEMVTTYKPYVEPAPDPELSSAP
jgi:hypothetical protein